MDVGKQPEANLGAFVEIDEFKAGRDTLHLLGMREGLDRWIDKLRHLSGQQSNLIVRQIMAEIADNMAVDRDGISVALTRAALKDKSGVINHIRKD
jgi:hypothetical protein